MNKVISCFVACGVMAILAATKTHAGCVCQCSDGQMRPACTGPFDVPPVCPATVCPFAPLPFGPQPLPLTRNTPCTQTKVCDLYGHCEWKQVCPK
jgi:hypothetical protein